MNGVEQCLGNCFGWILASFLSSNRKVRFDLPYQNLVYQVDHRTDFCFEIYKFLSLLSMICGWESKGEASMNLRISKNEKLHSNFTLAQVSRRNTKTILRVEIFPPRNITLTNLFHYFEISSKTVTKIFIKDSTLLAQRTNVLKLRYIFFLGYFG